MSLSALEPKTNGPARSASPTEEDLLSDEDVIDEFDSIVVIHALLAFSVDLFSVSMFAVID